MNSYQGVTTQNQKGLGQYLIAALLLLFVLFTCDTASAQAVSDEMVIQATDSANSLGNMNAGPEDFGQALLNFVTYGSYEKGDYDTPSLLATIAKVICVISLFVMATLAVVGGANFVIQTANKGVPGGQVISSFWMPIRISVATILLVPLGSGYSTLQHGVTKIAEYGNTHGSYLSGKGIDHLVSYGAYSPPLMADNKNLVNGVVAAELCMLHTNTSLRREAVTVNTKQVGETFYFSYDYTDTSSYRVSAPIPNYCGAVEITAPGAETTVMEGAQEFFTGNKWTSGADTLTRSKNSEQVASRLLTQKFTGIFNTIRSDAAAIAQILASDSSSLASLQDGTGSPESFSSMSTQSNQYATSASAKLNALYSKANVAVQKAVSEAVNAARSSVATDNQGRAWAEEIKALGWTALGTLYWQQSNDQKLINTIARTLSPNYIEAQSDGQFENDERLGDLMLRYRAMLDAAKSLTPPPLDGNSFGKIVSITEAGSSGSGFFKSWISSLSQSVMLYLVTDDDGDFVNQMQSTGQGLVSFIDLSYHATVLVPAAAAAANTTVQHVAEKVGDAGSGIPIIGKVISAVASPASGVAKGVAEGIYVAIEGYAELVKGLLGPLVIAGFILAVVLPSIPLFFWLMGVVSWILFYIECLLISPIWLSAHGTAEKEGWGSEHTRQGYMLMIGLYLNPILRSAGFFAVLVVIYPLGVLVKWLSSYMQGIISSGFLTSPFIIIGGMLALSFLAYSIAMRVFSLPNELFERGLRWVNGGQEVTGDENGTNRVTAMVTSFGYKAEGGMRGAGNAQPRPTTGGGGKAPMPN